MRFTRLADWLRWQETLNPKGIELGLERVAAVAERLGVTRLPGQVITVAGTNGKGSCVAYLEAILRAEGRSTGAYFSPHLVRYNERIRIDGAEADDAALVDAFAAVDAARGETPLTYFEFGTLAAFWLFVRAGVDVAVLEVGLGGRLDAVNVLDPDVSVVTSIGIDHIDWLGPDRETIGFEKAGIIRAGRPAVCGDPEPPRSLLEHAAALGAPLACVGRDYDARVQGDQWYWESHGRSVGPLRAPALVGEFQWRNAATALAALAAVERLPALETVNRGLASVRLPGRLQVLDGPVPVILDVAHNPAAARVLGDYLAGNRPGGRTRLVLGMLADKDVTGVVDCLVPAVDDWYAAGLEGPRGLSAEALGKRLEGRVAVRSRHPTVDAALAAAHADSAPGDRIVVCGSFLTVGAVLANPLYCPHSRRES